MKKIRENYASVFTYCLSLQIELVGRRVLFLEITIK